MAYKESVFLEITKNDSSCTKFHDIYTFKQLFEELQIPNFILLTVKVFLVFSGKRFSFNLDLEKIIKC